MPGLPRCHFVQMPSDTSGVECDDCRKATIEPWHWNTNRRSPLRRLCAECFRARKEHDQDHRYGLVNHGAD